MSSIATANGGAMRLFILLSIILFSFSSQASERFEYLIKLNKNYSKGHLQAFASNVEVVREDVIVLSLTQQEANKLKTDSRVTHISRNRLMQVLKTPNDLAPDQWAMDGRNKSGEAININALLAWDITTGTKDVVVAVIDTGADMTHPDLVDNFWVNVKERDGQPGVDDDNNGYIDDINGYHFGTNQATPTDTFGHGTHVAGTVGAKGNNNLDVVGVNWDVSLMILNIFEKAGARTSDSIRAIDYAVANGAQVINASWGGPGPAKGASKEELEEHRLLYEAIERAGKKGVVFVAAAGNDAANSDINPLYPAAYDLDNIISVGSVSNLGKVSLFSNYGKISVDVMAPGVGIRSTSMGGGSEILLGTSMASPHVAGIAGLMLAVNPTLTPSDIKNNLISTCNQRSALNGKCVCNGFVDAYASLKASMK